MNDKHLHKLKNLVMITTGTIVSLAGIAFIAVQYSKLLTTIFMNEDDTDPRNLRDSERINSRFSQIKHEDGSSPDTLDEDDLELDLEIEDVE